MLMPNTSPLRVMPLVMVAALVTVFAGCDSANVKKPASQVVAKVNSEEISVHQVNFALSRSNIAAVPAEEAPRVRREILDRLIDQQLAAEQAIEMKIDRSPDVLMALAAARREILARAYIDQIAAGQRKPTADEVKKYIAEHPQLFAERRIYHMQEIVLPAANPVGGALREMIAAGRSMDDIANWLKSKDIKYRGGSATRTAEQVPLDLLPKLVPLKDGQGLVVENTQSITVMRLVGSQRAPLGEAAAIPRVQQFLGNQLASEAAAREFKQVKEKAKISYAGEFANAEIAPSAVANAQTPAPATDLATRAMEKGASGLN